MRTFLVTLVFVAAASAKPPTAGQGCPSAGESLVESVVSEKGPSPEEAWTLAGCFWPEMTAALNEMKGDSPRVERRQSPFTPLDAALVELVRHHVRHSLTSEKPALPDTASAARRLFSILLDAKPPACRDAGASCGAGRPAAGTVVALMAHSTLHDHAFHSLRERINNPDVVRELAAVLANPILRNDAVTLLNLVRGRSAVAPLAEFLKHPDETVRGEAVWLLARTGGPETLPLAKESLNDDSPTVRYNAVWSLSLFPPSQAVPLLEPSLRDASPVVRRAAAAVAAQLADPAFVPDLLTLLKDTDPAVRTEALYALSSIADPASVPALAETLGKDPHPPARVMAAGALKHFLRDDATVSLLMALEDADERVQRAADHALGSLEERSMAEAGRRCRNWSRSFDRLSEEDKLTRVERWASTNTQDPPECMALFAAADSDPALSTVARAAAAYRGTPSAVRTLSANLQDGEFRRALLHFLSVAGPPSAPFAVLVMRCQDHALKTALSPLLVDVADPSVIEGLFKAYGDADLRLGAGAALSRWSRDSRQTPKFIEAMENPQLRSAAVEILWQAREPPVARELEKGLSHPDPEVRAASAQVLGSIGDSGTIAPLSVALHDPVPLVRTRAAVALGNLKDPSAVPLLVKTLKDPDDAVRYEAAWSIARTLREREGRPVDPGAEVIAALREALNDKVPTVRSAAAGAFMIMKPPQATPDLRQRLKDSNAQVRMDALVALYEIRTDEAAEAILSALDSPDAALRLRAVLILSRRLDEHVRRKLKQVGATDSSPLVRQAAAEALKQGR